MPDEVPTPNGSNDIKIDSERVLHDAERSARHALSHLEEDFLKEWRRMATFSETEAKKLLAWLASKIEPSAQ